MHSQQGEGQQNQEIVVDVRVGHPRVLRRADASETSRNAETLQVAPDPPAL